MAINKPIHQEEEEETQKNASKLALFPMLNKVFGLGGVFQEGIPMDKLKKAVFLSIIALFYIANSHMADKTVRKIDKLKKEVEDLRADYITLKASYMYDSKQSEVAKKVESLGLIESKRPPFKLLITENDLNQMPF